MIDAHAHVWSLARGDYDWLTPAEGGLYRDHLADELGLEMAAAGVDACVLVQAARTSAETDWLLGQAAAHPFVAGVVGWTDLAASVPDARRGLVGVRAMPEDRAGRGFDDAAFDAAFAAIAARGLAFDALCQPGELGGLAGRLARTPDLRVVLDHAGNPDGSAGWANDLRALGRAGAWCKLSGLATLPALADADALDIAMATILAAFPGRTLWGSDWPVVRQARGYATWTERARAFAAGTGTSARARLFDGAAREVYRLEADA